jgi:hypothetical protein
LETSLILNQVHDAYIFGQLDAAAILCRIALETELTIRYLEKYKLIQEVAEGKPFKEMTELPAKDCNGKPRFPTATLANLIIWALDTKIIPEQQKSIAWRIHNVGDDYAHAYAMRRVSKGSATGNLFLNTQALRVYQDCLKLISEMSEIETGSKR